MQDEVKKYKYKDPSDNGIQFDAKNQRPNVFLGF